MVTILQFNKKQRYAAKVFKTSTLL